MDHCKKTFPAVPLLLHAYPLPQERVYRTILYSGRLFSLIKNLLPSSSRRSVVCFAAVAEKRMLFQSHSLTTAVSLAPQFLLWVNSPQYFHMISVSFILTFLINDSKNTSQEFHIKCRWQIFFRCEGIQFGTWSLVFKGNVLPPSSQ
jgi:hypothetical protein